MKRAGLQTFLFPADKAFQKELMYERERRKKVTKVTESISFQNCTHMVSTRFS